MIFLNIQWQTVYEVTKELLQSKEEFTALYAISDLTAFGIYKAISEAGKKIPDDYSVLGLMELKCQIFSAITFLYNEAAM